MALKFGETASNKMVNKVLSKADETNMDHKKRDIPLEQIDMNKDNEYIFGYSDIEFLASEIEDSGFHGAIEVYAMPNGRYEIMSGHRRYMACKQLGFKTIPCIVSEVTDQATIAEQIIMSNIHHRDMTPLRMARAINYYAENVLKVKGKDYQGKKRTTLAEKFNMSETNIQRHMNILKLIPEIQALCDDKGFPITYFTETVAQCPKEVQKKLYNKLVQIAPEGKIEELSKKMVEMQLESIKAENQRNEEAKSRAVQTEKETEPSNEASRKPMQTPDQAAPVQPYKDSTDYNEGTSGTGFVSYNGIPDEIQNLDTPSVREHSLGTAVFDVNETVDSEVMYYIDRIENIIGSDAEYQDKDKLIDRLHRLVDILEK